ncbi:hypothetical protein A2548_07810 [candidate division WOR-1 bacterium RIFOXYD2_FULL_41_8]|uniref:Uncharacterized protein n=1 Tax=candidate division WOR-1 bacterium RIFOXYC2_FULL_41_25 TaxID=1802586 RepID=A0A1F4TNQ5_UNCSA|nr:MAG: hypothetical protein A2462_07765 [candidate division WOR-1 bacterium RIFOXYC2_FULL_41_25]OGC42709.1 MAG: hypothetical protein A2548_07810 [candidate division WOR-1 bacterium RIFOXYD2_FULL_41_8]
MTIFLVLLSLFVLCLAVNWYTLLKSKSDLWRKVAIFIALTIPILTPFFPQPRFSLDFFWWRVAGLIAIVMGQVIFFWAKNMFSGSEELFGDVPQEPITAGPFQFVRHPMYLGFIFIIVGWWWLWQAIYAFYFGLFIVALLWIQAYLEERLLLVPKFGDKYLGYRQQTGMFWIK